MTPPSPGGGCDGRSRAGGDRAAVSPPFLRPDSPLPTWVQYGNWQLNLKVGTGLGIRNRHFSKKDIEMVSEMITSTAIMEMQIKIRERDFPGSSVIRIPNLHCAGPGFDSWLSNWDPTCFTVWPEKRSEMAWPLLKTIVPQKFHRIPRYPVIPLLSIYPYMAWLHPRSVQDRRVMVERSDRMWSTGEWNGKPLQYSCLENPMNGMKRENDRILKD